MMKYFKIILLLSFIISFSQNKKIDSLELILDTHLQKDSVRVDVLNEIAFELYQNDKEKAIELIAEASIISDSLNYKKGKAENLYIAAKIHIVQYKLDQAKKETEQALKLFKAQNNKLGIAKSLNNIGAIYFFKNENDTALEYFYNALEINTDAKDNLVKADTYNKLGVIFNNKKKIKDALNYYKKAVNIYEKLKDFRNQSKVLNNIGIIYIYTKEYNKAFDIYEKCIIINKKNNDNFLLANSYNNLGSIFLGKKKYNKAFFYFSKGLQINLGINNYLGICSSENGLGEALINLKRLNEAVIHLKNSEKIATKYSILQYQVEISKLFSDLYYTKKKYRKSLFYYKKYKKYYDSVFRVGTDNRFSILEKKYKFKEKELRAKEKEIKLIEQVKKTNEKLDKTKEQVTLAGITLIVLLVAFIFILYYSRIKRLSTEYQKISLEQKLLRSQMKPHFVFNSLSVLQGIVLQKEYRKAHTYISKFSRLLRKILENSREEIVNLETELSIIENYIFLRDMSSIHSQCTHKITVAKNIDVKNIFIPPMIVQPIVENAFEHGFVESNKKYLLEIDFKFKDKNLICTITDNGKGLYNKINSNNSEKKSISSTILLERLHLFSTKYKKEYSLKIIDRKEFGKQGTKVILLIPHKIIKND